VICTPPVARVKKAPAAGVVTAAPSLCSQTFELSILCSPSSWEARKSEMTVSFVGIAILCVRVGGTVTGT
jgi:hypothetical protein